MRSHCTEFGVVAPKGGWNAKELAAWVEAGENERIPRQAYPMLRLLSDRLHELNEKIAETDNKIEEFFKSNEACQRLAKVPGIGVISATCLVATVGDTRQYYRGGHFAAYLGSVPRQWSSGGKSSLLGNSKRGDKYLWRLRIHGARALCRTSVLESDRCPLKFKRLIVDKQKKVNVAAVAVANTNTRIV